MFQKGLYHWSLSNLGHKSLPGNVDMNAIRIGERILDESFIGSSFHVLPLHWFVNAFILWFTNCISSNFPFVISFLSLVKNCNHKRLGIYYLLNQKFTS